MANLFTPAIPRTIGANSAVIPGARLYFYLTQTFTPISVFADYQGTVPLVNPVVADSSGIFPPIYLDPTQVYRVRWTDASGTILRPDLDPVAGYDESAITSAALQAELAAISTHTDALQTASDRIQTGSDRAAADISANSATASANTAVAAATSPSFKIQPSFAAATTPPSGVTAGQTYWVVDATQSSLILYDNPSGTGSQHTPLIQLPLSPSLSALITSLSVYSYVGGRSPAPAAGTNVGAGTYLVLSPLSGTKTLTRLRIFGGTAGGVVRLVRGTIVGGTWTRTGFLDVGTATANALNTFTFSFACSAGEYIGVSASANTFAHIPGQTPDGGGWASTGLDASTGSVSSTQTGSQLQFGFDETVLSPILSDIAALQAATTWTEVTNTSVGAQNPVAGVSSSSPTLWTLNTAFSSSGTVISVFIDAKTTGTLTLRVIRSGSQVGPDYPYTVSSTGPQNVTVSVPVLAGDNLRFTGLAFGYNSPATGDDAHVNELAYPTYGFRLGATEAVSVTMPLKTKVASIAAGGGNLSQKIACWGDSLTAYAQNPSQSYPAQLAGIFAIPVFNGGVSGETMPQIKVRFDPGTQYHDQITIFEAYNGFSSPDDYLTALAAMVAQLLPANSPRFLVQSCWNGDIQPVGSTGYNQIALLNKRLQTAYPFNFVDTRTHLIQSGLNDAGITPTSGDLTDITNDVIPRSLRLPADFLHGNASAYGVVARQLANVIRSNHWLNS